MSEQIKTCTKGNYYTFPIMTAMEYCGGKEFPMFCKNDGIAKLEHIKEVAVIGGWGMNQVLIPQEIHEWKEGDKYFKSECTELFILNAKLIMN